jgi:hypothetical protein
VHLDNNDLDADDLAYLELPTDKEAVESATEQRALTTLFETHRHEKTVWRLVAAERRAAVDDLAVVRANRHISITWWRRTR